MGDYCCEDKANAQGNAKRAGYQGYVLRVEVKPGVLILKLIFVLLELQILAENAGANKRRAHHDQKQVRPRHHSRKFNIAIV